MRRTALWTRGGKSCVQLCKQHERTALDLFAGHLAVLPLFRGLTPLQIAAIARSAERVVYNPGAVIIEENALAEAAVLIVAGNAARVSGPELAARSEPVAAGSLLGEAAMLVETTYGSTVVARTAVRAVHITRDALQAQMLAGSELGRPAGAEPRQKAHAASPRSCAGSIPSLAGVAGAPKGQITPRRRRWQLSGRCPRQHIDELNELGFWARKNAQPRGEGLGVESAFARGVGREADTPGDVFRLDGGHYRYRVTPPD